LAQRFFNGRIVAGIRDELGGAVVLLQQRHRAGGLGGDQPDAEAAIALSPNGFR